MNNILSYSIVHPNDGFLDLLNSNLEIDTVILYSLEESLNWQYLFENDLTEKLKFIKNKKVILVVNDTCKYDSFDGHSLIKLPAFLLKTAYRIENGQEVNKEWNYKSSKALILTGKAHNANRIGFLVECVKSGILKNHIYSFFSPKEKNYLENTKMVFNELCDWDYDEFVKEYENNPDNIDIRNNEEDMHYSGFPYSVDLFTDTCISVVLETNLWSTDINNPDVSEKTYKAIVNKHPFLMINQLNSLKFLNTYGFYTFEDFMLHKDYEFEENVFEKNRLVVDNLNYFLNNFQKNKESINSKVEHNYNLMMQIYKEFKDKYPEIHLELSKDFFIR